MKKLIVVIFFLIPVLLFLANKAYSMYQEYEDKTQEEQKKIVLKLELDSVKKEFYDNIYNNMIKNIRECGLSDLETTFEFRKDEYSDGVEKYYVIPINDYFSDHIKNYTTNEEKIDVIEKCFSTVKNYHNKTYEFINNNVSKIIVVSLKSLAHFNITDSDDIVYRRSVSVGSPVYYINDELIGGIEYDSSKDYVGKKTIKKNYNGCSPNRPHYVCTTVEGENNKLYKSCICKNN